MRDGSGEGDYLRISHLRRGIVGASDVDLGHSVNLRVKRRHDLRAKLGSEFCAVWQPF